jgi:hypothetical protein
MANPEHVQIVQGEECNKWRLDHPDIILDLHEADLREADFSAVNLAPADLSRANLSTANLRGANLGPAYLTKSRALNLIRHDFSEPSLIGVTLLGADTQEGDLRVAYLIRVDLSEANLTGADLRGANLSSADLGRARLNKTRLWRTDFSDVNLRDAKGLEECDFEGPCILDIRAIQQSGMLPLPFLRGCGLPDSFIEYLPSLLNDPIQFYSCFISYSTNDQEFADRLREGLQNKGVRCWFAAHDMKGGDRIYDQIDRAIQAHDRVLLILTEASMASRWVETEMRKAFAKEKRDNRRVLFPLAMAPFEQVRAWECFDSDTGEDLARKVREYFIPDFSNWKDHDSYTKAFERLLRDLKSQAQDKATA